MKTIDMTEGSTISVLLRFSFPIMLGDLFQQLYITTDSVMLGQFAGSEPLAAVGSTTFLIRLIIGLFTGISTGSCVVIAQCCGAKDYERLHKAVHTMAALTLIGGAALTFCGLLITEPLLHLVSTPDDIFRQAAVYLKIYFAGSLFDLIYNVGSGIIQAAGDSKRPFIYLIISSLTNIILDYLLIAVCHSGTAGAAAGTVIAQSLASFLVITYLVRTKHVFRLSVPSIKIEKSLVPAIIRMGLPAGLQNMIVSLSNVIIQANINGAGTAAVAGFGVFNKVDSIIMLPLNSIALASMTFAGQNYGAGKRRRITDGIKTMFLLEFASWVTGMSICLIFREHIFRLFTADTHIIHYAMLTMWYDMPCYWALGMGLAMTSIIRGMGHSRSASVILISTMCILRQIWIFAAKAAGFGIGSVLASYPISWILLLAGTVLYTIYLNMKHEFRDTLIKSR
jgi:putative MATE family efflux protein